MNPRLLAFYLPQFHPTPENDLWWGKGFTEWTNVTRTRPRFPGHYQPHLPADLGFYDLRLPETRQAQADLARAHGIHGFCYYHYWFNGRRLLHRPFDEVLASGQPDFPFCLCWANENWTRAWDGREREVLISQNYGPDDDRAHMRWLCGAFADPRYLRIDGRPLFLVYRLEDLPDPAATAALWRQEARAVGVGEIYLAAVENPRAGQKLPLPGPAETGFDAAVEFAPNAGEPVPPLPWARALRFLRRLAPWLDLPSHNFLDYPALADTMSARPDPPYRRFRCVTPSWDNSSRRRRGATVFLGASPARYQAWLTKVLRRTAATAPGDEALVFINAWNEWAEGNHLEPCQRWNHAHLEATARALQDASGSADAGTPEH